MKVSAPFHRHQHSAAIESNLRLTLEVSNPDRQSRFNTHTCRVRRKRGRLPSNVSIRSDPALNIPPLHEQSCAGSLQIES